DEGFTLVAGEETFTARALLIATGATHRPLGVPGEERLRGKGVSYCATCDGRFFRGKRVAVVGGGNTAAEDALYLARLCEEVVLIHRRDPLRASRALQEQVLATPNITVKWNTTVAEIAGEARVERLELLTDGEANTLPIDGVFVAVGVQPNNALFPTLPQDAGGFLLANEDGETDIPGLFVAGDVRAKRCRQLVTAAGDGAAAAVAAERWLSEL
ncbi:MAG: FAD-dependent oxidoreductase, partial [Clostridia bacterium]|nr:FAD-dependent oxidoreductase [Clostridia bacterium]